MQSPAQVDSRTPLHPGRVALGNMDDQLSPSRENRPVILASCSTSPAGAREGHMARGFRTMATVAATGMPPEM